MRDTHHSETRILATMIATGVIPDGLSNDMFADQDLRNMAIMAMECRRIMGALSPTILADWLEIDRGLDFRKWLLDFADQESLADPSILPQYVAILASAREEATLKEAIDSLGRMPITDPAEDRERALSELSSLSIGRNRARVLPAATYLSAVLDGIQARFDAHDIPGIPTGIPTLDRLTGGWQASDLTILAARPAVGKTAMALNLALAAARAGRRVTVISAEQPAEQIVQRLMSIISGVPAWKLRAPKALLDSEWSALTRSCVEIKDLPIAIMDDSSPTVAHIAHHCRLVPADLVLVDYVQRIRVPGATAIYDRVSAVAHGLKELARAQRVAVVALAQINRAGASGARMEHLKGSGDLEQEADEVLILERPESGGTATLALEKNRHGPTGAIDLVFNAPCLRFGEMAQQQQSRGNSDDF